MTEIILAILPILLFGLFCYVAIYRNLGGILASFGRYDHAKRILDARISNHPADVIALSQRASVEFALDNYEAAMNDYTTALNSDIEKLERWTVRKFGGSIILTARAQVHFVQGDYASAQQDLQEAHRIKPMLHAAVAWLAIIAYASGHHGDATQWWQQAVEMYPNYAKLTQNGWPQNVLGWHTPPNKKAQDIIEVLNSHHR